MGCGFFFFFFFKQKTAYEIGTGDWSSDVCSSDLVVEHDRHIRGAVDSQSMQRDFPARGHGVGRRRDQIGRASCRERV